MSGSISASTLAAIGLATSVAGTAVGAIGSMQQGNAAAAASNYNAQVAAENAVQAQDNAARAGAAGAQQAAEESQKTRATVGAIKAAQAANGVDVGTGSAVDVRSSAAELGQLSAINIRSNAAKTAYGYQVQSANDTAQSKLDNYDSSQQTTAGEIGAGSTILGGASNAASNYAKFLQQASPITT